MTCRCFGLDLSRMARRLGQTAHLMVGQPDYAIYVRHLAETHPDQAAMSRDDFFREREAARYGGAGRLRCC